MQNGDNANFVITPLGSAYMSPSGALATLVPPPPQGFRPCFCLISLPITQPPSGKLHALLMYMPIVSPTQACELHEGRNLCFVYCCLLTVNKTLPSKQVLKSNWKLNDEVVMKVSLRYSRTWYSSSSAPVCRALGKPPDPQNWVCSSVTWGHDARRLWWHQDIICKEGGTQTPLVV